MASRQYYTLPTTGAGVERRSAAPVSIGVESPRFHPHAKGKNIRLDGQLRRATRKNSFCNGITFSHRPIHLYEKVGSPLSLLARHVENMKVTSPLCLQVRLRLTGVHTGWSGALRFGFTSLDPSELDAPDIPKYACPDLVTRPGYWAKALPERLALKDNVLSFWADRHGRVFYSINEGEPILFHCGLSIGCPLWAIVDIYGITQEVTLLGKRFVISFTIHSTNLSENHLATTCNHLQLRGWNSSVRQTMTLTNPEAAGVSYTVNTLIANLSSFIELGEQLCYYILQQRGPVCNVCCK